MDLDGIKEKAIACGWVDLFENEGNLWGYASDRDVMPQMYPQQPDDCWDTPALQEQGVIGVMLGYEDTLGLLGCVGEPIADEARIYPRQIIDRTYRDTSIRFQDGGRHPWRLDNRGDRSPQTPTPRLEIQLPHYEGRGARSLWIENIHYRFLGLSYFFCEFDCDPDDAAEYNFGEILAHDRRVRFTSSSRPDSVYAIVSASCIRVGKYLRVRLELNW